MINAAKELARTVGHYPNYTDGVIAAADEIISGQFVKLAAATSAPAGAVDGDSVCVKPILGNETAADVDILGIAADDTKRLPYNGLYQVIDNFFKNGKVSAFVLGGLFTIWNDGRGAVFAADVQNAAVGTPLYIHTDGTLTKTAGTATQVGEIVVGSILRAPASADGTLFFKAKGL